MSSGMLNVSNSRRNYLLLLGGLLLVGTVGMISYRALVAGKRTGPMTTRVVVSKGSEATSNTGSRPGKIVRLPVFTREEAGARPAAQETQQAPARLPDESDGEYAIRTAGARQYRAFLSSAALDESQRARLRQLVEEFRREVMEPPPEPARIPPSEATVAQVAAEIRDVRASGLEADELRRREEEIKNRHYPARLITREERIAKMRAEREELNRSFRERLRQVLDDRQYQEFDRRFPGNVVLSAFAGAFAESS